MAPIDTIADRAFHSKRFHLAESISQTTSIIVIIVGAVGGCILLLSLYRFIRHFSSRRFAPLPPVQPIAHHRQQQLALFSERNNGSLTPTQWPHLSTPQELSPYESSLSLPPSKEVDILSQPVSPLQPSFYSGENSLTELSSSGQIDHRRMPKLSRPDDHRRNSIGSVGSAHFVRPSTAHSSSSTPPTLPHRRRLHSIASHTSIASRSSGGLPHGPHSQVKIVLPAPLAPPLMPSNTGSTENVLFPVASDSWQNRGSVRLSVADMWAPSLHRTASDDQISKLSGESIALTLLIVAAKLLLAPVGVYLSQLLLHGGGPV